MRRRVFAREAVEQCLEEDHDFDCEFREQCSSACSSFRLLESEVDVLECSLSLSS